MKREELLTKFWRAGGKRRPAYPALMMAFLISSVFRFSSFIMVPYSPLCHCLIFGCLITLEIMYLLIVFLPLLGSSVAGFFGRFLGAEGTAIVTTTCVSFSSIFSFLAFYEVAPGASACYLRIAPWIESEMFDASWGFFGDREVTG